MVKSRLIPEQSRVLAQNPVADGMKSPAPQRPHLLPTEQIRHAPHHFLRRLVRERQQKNAIRRNPLLQQIRHPIRQRARLARTRPGDHERRPRLGAHRRELLFIQLARVINLQMDCRPKRLQHVIA